MVTSTTHSWKTVPDWKELDTAKFVRRQRIPCVLRNCNKGCGLTTNGTLEAGRRKAVRVVIIQG